MKNKIIITVALITALMLLATFLAFGIVLTFGLAIEYHIGIITPVAFVVAAIIFGRYMNKVIDKLKILWEC